MEMPIRIPLYVSGRSIYLVRKKNGCENALFLYAREGLIFGLKARLLMLMCMTCRIRHENERCVGSVEGALSQERRKANPEQHHLCLAEAELREGDMRHLCPKVIVSERPTGGCMTQGARERQGAYLIPIPFSINGKIAIY